MRRARGFTLVEVMAAMVLLGTMMLLLYAGLNFSLRSWNATDVNGRRVADARITENFLRREVAELYPMRWRDPNFLRYAFEGKAHEMRFVSSRRAGVSVAGLSVVGLDVEPGKAPRTFDLVMRRAQASGDVNDFTPLADAEPSVLLADVDGVDFSYFGSLNDFTDPEWMDEWKFDTRMPTLVRVTVHSTRAEPPPPMLFKLMVAPEAGCFENVFQRDCRPRRPTTP
ncbi:MAG TPA: prepilin-type N-terminal cleavage/methylation domain-containing protein [Usitatibacter sp.]|jgi:general secretion pathway protein J|nr:prepilin-type N-terminal cleavage/methylation domain-containing protein [Usitatibacter sp.]